MSFPGQHDDGPSLKFGESMHKLVYKDSCVFSEQTRPEKSESFRGMHGGLATLQPMLLGESANKSRRRSDGSTVHSSLRRRDIRRYSRYDYGATAGAITETWKPVTSRVTSRKTIGSQVLRVKLRFGLPTTVVPSKA